jgi:hypothetical protein
LRPHPGRKHEIRAHLDDSAVTRNDELVHTDDATDQRAFSAMAANFGHPIHG